MRTFDGISTPEIKGMMRANMEEVDAALTYKGDLAGLTSRTEKIRKAIAPARRMSALAEELVRRAEAGEDV